MRRVALTTRAELREGRKLHVLVDAGSLQFNDMDARQRQLHGEFVSHELHRKADAANKEYGHGIARTNDYGVAEGEQRAWAILQIRGEVAVTPSAIAALERGEVTVAEGFAFQAFMARGHELEGERAEARASVEGLCRGRGPAILVE